MTDKRHTRADRAAWFHEARFGMFLHWGCSSVAGRAEWVMFQDKVPLEEYRQLADRFKPTKYDPRQWAAVARDAGMKYMVLTTRHHDGYALWDSRVSDFTAPKTGPRRDLVAAYAEACRAAGLKVGFYYSLADWRWPVWWKGKDQDPAQWADLVGYVHEQVRELMTHYGRVDVLWYDGGAGCGNPQPVTAEDWQARKLNALVRRLQPGILINDRSLVPEDIATFEQHLPGGRPAGAWETCMTMNKHWGHMAADRVYKSATELVHLLTACASGGGNFLLNVGPLPDGRLPRPAVVRLQAIGRWLRRYGEAVYGNGPAPYDAGTNGVWTQKGRHVYLHVHWWPGSTVILCDMPRRVRRAELVGTRQRATIVRRGRRVFLTGLPSRPPDPHTTVIRLELED